MIYAVVQARMGSSRLRGKSLLKVGNFPLFELVLRRVTRSKLIKGTIAALPNTPDNNILESIALNCGVEVVRGDTEDVLSRFLMAINGKMPCYVVRVCADNPLISPEAIDMLCNFFDPTIYDIAQNNLSSSGYPDGVGAEILTSECLVKLDTRAKDKVYREHVTLFAYKHPQEFRVGEAIAPLVWYAPHLRLDIDYSEDYQAMCEFVQLLQPNPIEATLDNIIMTGLQYSDIFERRRQRD